MCCYRCFRRLVINSGYIAAFTRKYGIKRVEVSAYHPAANRMIERGHKPLTDALTKLINGGLGSWVKNLLVVLFADRTFIHQPTRKTPF